MHKKRLISNFNIESIATYMCTSQSFTQIWNNYSHISWRLQAHIQCFPCIQHTTCAYRMLRIWYGAYIPYITVSTLVSVVYSLYCCTADISFLEVAMSIFPDLDSVHNNRERDIFHIAIMLTWPPFYSPRRGTRTIHMLHTWINN